MRDVEQYSAYLGGLDTIIRSRASSAEDLVGSCHLVVGVGCRSAALLVADTVGERDGNTVLILAALLLTVMDAGSLGILDVTTVEISSVTLTPFVTILCDVCRSWGSTSGADTGGCVLTWCRTARDLDERVYFRVAARSIQCVLEVTHVAVTVPGGCDTSIDLRTLFSTLLDIVGIASVIMLSHVTTVAVLLTAHTVDITVACN